MKLLKYIFGILIIGLIIGFVFFAVTDVPVETSDIQIKVPLESLSDDS